MPNPLLIGVGIAAVGVGGNILANNAESNAAKDAANDLTAGTSLSTDVLRQLFNANQKAAQPFVNLGKPAAALESAMLTSGQTASEQAMSSDPILQAIRKSVEGTSKSPEIADAVFGRISPAITAKLVQDRLKQLNGLAGLGLSSIEGQGGDALQTLQGIGTNDANAADTAVAQGNLNTRYNTANLMQIPSALGSAKALYTKFGTQPNTAGASSALDASMLANPNLY
jgi:hypothetical protein